MTLAGGTEININDGDTVKQFTTTLFAPNGQVVGSVIDAVLSGPTDENEEHHIKKITLDSISVPIYENVDYYMTTFSRPPLESILNNKKITLFPNYWRVDGITNKRDTPLGVHLVFSSDMAHSNYQNVTEKGVQVNGSYPSVTQRGKHYPEFYS